MIYEFGLDLWLIFFVFILHAICPATVDLLITCFLLWQNVLYCLITLTPEFSTLCTEVWFTKQWLMFFLSLKKKKKRQFSFCIIYTISDIFTYTLHCYTRMIPYAHRQGWKYQTWQLRPLFHEGFSTCLYISSFSMLGHLYSESNTKLLFII